ncbi:PREDICTED: Golgi resident protein GCP60 [Lipotes vexillifer]|uniref:Golgi resident protein GCP60 n=2 Tax=Laurasiatheria TaxID=314145 RepID=A0A340X5F4_LIPVE|nr:PREDICTED: Golgi resident protein GCP60 [Lipotes vexillifer]
MEGSSPEPQPVSLRKPQSVFGLATRELKCTCSSQAGPQQLLVSLPASLSPDPGDGYRAAGAAASLAVPGAPRVESEPGWGSATASSQQTLLGVLLTPLDPSPAGHREPPERTAGRGPRGRRAVVPSLREERWQEGDRVKVGTGRSGPAGPGVGASGGRAGPTNRSGGEGTMPGSPRFYSAAEVPVSPPPLPPPSPPGSGRGPGAAGEQPEPGEAAAGGAAEEARRLEQRWGFGLEELYGLALRFFKEKDGKAFHPTYEEKLKLVALPKQVLMGPYNPDTCPEVGFFDVLGNDRRREWAALGNMSKEDAMVEFVKLLNRCCHLFSTYVASHKIEKEEQEKKRKEEEERRRREEEERERLQKEEEKRRQEEEERLRREEEERRRIEEERLRLEQQKQQIMAALNSQTAVQFQQYAAQQYPGNYEQQQILIRQLQEQHYQQYMQQLYQVQLAQQQAALQKQQEVAVAGASLPTSSKVNTTMSSDMTSVNGQAKTHTDNSEKELEPEAAEEALENGPKESLPVIAAPSMWTRPQIKDFKEKIRQDADSVITVGRGEVVTVRVPTHEEGSYLFWEFATDSYDIGFGVYFEWTDSPNTAVSVHVSESSDDDEEEEENISSEEKAKKNANKPLLDEIVPVYRRDCHEEVYAGSHQYPGRGVYLLKFDNSYSLWRSKSVYYRVYYTR